MSMPNQLEEEVAGVGQTTDGNSLLPLILERPTTGAGVVADGLGIIIGELIGMTDDGRTPLVVFRGQVGSAAVAARSVVDVHGDHVGRHVVLAFEDADHAKPIIMGVLCDGQGFGLAARGQVEVDVDGNRMVVDAKRELVLRCGKASITLTTEGKVLIQGTFVSTRSSGVNRIKGGSVQIN
jgi:hypothetical protein